MFDIGFWELTIISVVALIVIGPERLPSVARTVGLWVGKMKRVVGDMKMEIDKELKTDELKKILQKQADSAGIHEILEEGKSALDQANSDLGQAKNTIHEELHTPVIDEPTEGVVEPALDETVTSDRETGTDSKG